MEYVVAGAVVSAFVRVVFYLVIKDRKKDAERVSYMTGEKRL